MRSIFKTTLNKIKFFGLDRIFTFFVVLLFLMQLVFNYHIQSDAYSEIKGQLFKEYVKKIEDISTEFKLLLSGREVLNDYPFGYGVKEEDWISLANNKTLKELGKHHGHFESIEILKADESKRHPDINDLAYTLGLSSNEDLLRSKSPHVDSDDNSFIHIEGNKAFFYSNVFNLHDGETYYLRAVIPSSEMDFINSNQKKFFLSQIVFIFFTMIVVITLARIIFLKPINIISHIQSEIAGIGQNGENPKLRKIDWSDIEKNEKAYFISSKTLKKLRESTELLNKSSQDLYLKLKSSETEKASMLSTFAHDAQHPVSILKSTLQKNIAEVKHALCCLSYDSVEYELQKRFFEKNLVNYYELCEQIMSTSEDLVEVAKSQSGYLLKNDVCKNEESIYEIMSSVVEGFKMITLVKYPYIDIEILFVDNAPIFTKVDKNKFKRVLSNLIS
ncbi:MAG: hypothetical protein IE909_16470, partial [Campylobacterales bacterium]|nr:hypothetical protein [Campylobacterales bacterium]